MNRDQSVVFQYQLLPLKPGRFKVGPFRYAAGGKSTDLSGIDIKVVDPQAAGRQKAGERGELPQTLFAKLSTPETRVYNQQVFNLDIEVYSREGINLAQNINLLNLPATGLKIGTFHELGSHREAVKNELYDVRRFRCKASAMTAGTFSLQPTVRVNVLTRRKRQRSRGFFDGFFGNTATQPVELQPEPLELTVQPFPHEGRPANFSGAVGKFSFDVTAKPTELTVGDPITVNMQISGSGNIEGVTAPEIAAIEGFKVYESRLVSKDIQEARASGRKLFEQVVLPRTAEANELPPITFSYFDPVEKRYKTISRGPFPLVLHASSNANARLVGTSGRVRGGTRVLGSDIVYLKPVPRHWRRTDQRPWYGKRLFLAVQLIPVLGVTGLFLVMRRRRDLNRDIARARRQRAPKSARAGLKKAELALARQERQAFFEGVWETLNSYFGNRLNLAPGEISARVVTDTMKSAGLPQEDCDWIQHIFTMCEGVRFGNHEKIPASDKTGEFADLLKSLKRVLRTCEKVRI